jgi:hypothetical protein
VLIAGLLALSGCGQDDVAVPAPMPPATAVDACRQLQTELPATVLDGARVMTDPASEFTAAWGDPAITLTCGVPRPAARTADAQLLEVNGVTWFPQDLSNGTRFTTEERVANVQVDVPIDYRPEAEALIGLAPAIATNVPAKS